MKTRIRIVLVTINTAMIAILAGYIYFAGRREKPDVINLRHQINELQEKNREAVVTRQVSKQMEEIAYQQKEISDIRQEEAVNQRKIAERLRVLSEKETKRAQDATKEANRNYTLMVEQKKQAEESKRLAITARNKADTLTNLTLARSLGSLAVSKYETGEKELSRILAWYSWMYNKENGGNPYQEEVFQALLTISGTSLSISVSGDAIRDIVIYNNKILAASQNGRIEHISFNGSSWKKRTIYNDNQTDFRKIISFGNDVEQSIIVRTASGELMHITGKGKSALLNKNPGPVEVKNSGITVSVRDTISGILAVGKNDGSIDIQDKEGKTLKQLTGHLSAVTSLLFYDRMLLSAGYDCTLRLWNLNERSPRPILLKTFDGWVYSLGLCKKCGYAVAGDEKGYVSLIPLSPGYMAQEIKKTIRRDFTPEEKEYYTGLSNQK